MAHKFSLSCCFDALGPDVLLLVLTLQRHILLLIWPLSNFPPFSSFSLASSCPCFIVVLRLPCRASFATMTAAPCPNGRIIRTHRRRMLCGLLGHTTHTTQKHNATLANSLVHSSPLYRTSRPISISVKNGLTIDCPSLQRAASLSWWWALILLKKSGSVYILPFSSLSLLSLFTLNLFLNTK